VYNQLQSLERARNLAADLRDGGRLTGAARAGGAGQHALSKHTAAQAAEKGVGTGDRRHEGGLHALADNFCRPWVIILTPGNVADCTVASECVSLTAGSTRKLLGDKAYDSDSSQIIHRCPVALPADPPVRYNLDDV
jgi:hypothetical protein